MIDGGFFTKVIKKDTNKYPDDSDEYIALLKKYIDAIRKEHGEILRILYYDCYPFKGGRRKILSPISKTPAASSGKKSPLNELGRQRQIALRTGSLKFRGFRLSDEKQDEANLTDEDSITVTSEDFRPVFEQKGIDVKIAVDMIIYSINKLVNKIVLVSNDTDFIPAIKEARRNGLQIETVSYNGYRIHDDIIKHSDFVRKIEI